MKVHIALVGGQPLPVFRVVQDQEPDRIILWHSEQTLPDAKRIEKVAKVKASYMMLNPVDIGTIEKSVEKLKEEVTSHPENSYSIDLTGGTKLWAILLYRTFIEIPDIKLLYIDQNNQVYDLRTGKSRAAKVEVDIQQSFEITGAVVDSWIHLNDLSQQESNVARQLWKLQETLHFEVFTQLFTDAPWVGMTNSRSVSRRGYGVKWSNSDKKIELSFPDGRKPQHMQSPYLFDMAENNGWYEFLVADFLHKWSEAKEVWLNSEITSPSSHGTIVDEIDVIVRTNNRLIFVECKTGKINKKEISTIVEKSKRYGGLSTLSLLVTLKPLSKLLIDACRESNVLYFNLPQYSMRKTEPEIQKELYDLLNNQLMKINRR